MTKHRCFIAIRLDPASQASLQALMEGLKERVPEAQWVKPANAHLTLKFLGNVNHERLERVVTIIKLACDGMDFTPLEMQGLGVFPSPKSPRILWLGLAGEVFRLNAIVQRLDDQLEALGWQKEKQTWVPHITLARFDGIRHRPAPGQTHNSNRQETRERMLKILEQNAGKNFGTLKVTSVDLMESTLTPSGAIYHPLFVCSLKPS